MEWYKPLIFKSETPFFTVNYSIDNFYTPNSKLKRVVSQLLKNFYLPIVTMAKSPENNFTKNII